MPGAGSACMQTVQGRQVWLDGHHLVPEEWQSEQLARYAPEGSKEVGSQRQPFPPRLHRCWQADHEAPQRGKL